MLVGSSGVINEQNMPWINSVVKKKQTKNTRKRPLRPGYEIFAQYAEMIDDSYWKTFFDNASTGRIKGVKLKDDYLVHKHGKQESRISVHSGPDAIMKFFITKLGLRSHHDIKHDNDAYDRYREWLDRQSYQKWSQIRSDVIKIQLIVTYCNKLKAEHNLSVNEYNLLKSVININTNIGTIGNSNIFMNNKFIEYINNLVWNPATRKFIVVKSEDIDISNVLTVSNDQDKQDKRTKSEKPIEWLDYLKIIKRTNNCKNLSSKPNYLTSNVQNSTGYSSSSYNLSSNIQSDSVGYNLSSSSYSSNSYPNITPISFSQGYSKP